MHILDRGCGPKTITADFIALVLDGHVIGLDVAPGVLEMAQATAAERGMYNISLRWETSMH